MSTVSAWTDIPASLDGVKLFHRMRAGDQPLLMVHGVGPGTTGRANFGPLLDRLPARFALHLIDLAGFGASGRRTAQPFFDVRFWLRQINLAIDHIMTRHGAAPMLIGNSVGGALVLKAAADRAEIERVLAIGAPVGPPATPELRRFWTAPSDAASLAEAMRPMTGPAADPDPSLVRERLQVFQSADYGTYFNAMLAEPDRCLEAVALTPQEASGLRARVALLHGREDRACPVSHTLNTLLPRLPGADLTLFGGCGHNLIAERTEAVLVTIARLAEENNPQ